ncbi:Exonuclease SbcC [Nocardioides sp. AX2bis]|nr:Exonuclease SbcC [Nocardioides sp. AX2bis]
MGGPGPHLCRARPGDQLLRHVRPLGSHRAHRDEAAHPQRRRRRPRPRRPHLRPRRASEGARRDHGLGGAQHRGPGRRLAPQRRRLTRDGDAGDAPSRGR